MAQVWRWDGKRHRRWVWPTRLGGPLKAIPISVRADDADASLDLQAVLNTAYDRAGYDMRVDYREDPRVPLTPRATAWARGVVEASK
jgi:hypothetical protein